MQLEKAAEFQEAGFESGKKNSFAPYPPRENNVLRDTFTKMLTALEIL